MQTEAWELIAAREAPHPFALCCEHASNRLPAGWRWPEADDWVRETHWAYDIGAEQLTRELAEATGAPAIVARFSRLLVDPNRPLDSPTLIRRLAEGRTVTLNDAVGSEERARRVALWEAYHDRLGQCCR